MMRISWTESCRRALRFLSSSDENSTFFPFTVCAHDLDLSALVFGRRQREREVDRTHHVRHRPRHLALLVVPLVAAHDKNKAASPSSRAGAADLHHLEALERERAAERVAEVVRVREVLAVRLARDVEAVECGGGVSARRGDVVEESWRRTGACARP